ncbi:MAG: M15 family metallopeptidase [Treponema sp.]|jgi:hypothetical protein|nr:M15 family metallopeptidase [Treponema sp.]
MMPFFRFAVMRLILGAALSVLLVLPLYGGARKERSGDEGALSARQAVEPEQRETPAPEAADPAVQEAPGLAALPSQARAEAPAGRAEIVMKTLAAAYPDRTGQAEFRNGDWALPVYGEWFYYAEGRLLPENLRDQVNEYDPQPFYTYTAELPPWKEPSEEDSARMREMMERRGRRPAKRSQHFYDALWRAHNRDESWERVKQIRFLGHTVMVHYSILEELSLVEERILEEAKTNAQVRQWINGINSVDGWNWRNIAATVSRSFHSYGAAIDCLPKSQGGLETYWQWTARTITEWWTVPYSRRLHPPQEVIKAFESFGFLWGGKWTTYDTMHFEYRPEILLYSGIPQANLR